MLKVNPGIRTVSQNEDFSLADITVVTLKNTGTHVIKWGFGDGVTIKLEEGQAVSIEAGANTVFTSSAVLRIEFEKPEIIKDSDFAAATLIFNRLTDISAAWGKMVDK